MREQWPILAVVCLISLGAANRLLGKLMVASGLFQVAALAVFIWASPLWARYTALGCILLLVVPPLVLTDRAVKAWQSGATTLPP